MIRLIMCEGSNELEIMRILIKNNKLIFGEDDLLGLTPYHARQLNNSQVKTALKNTEKVFLLYTNLKLFYRIYS